MKDLVLALDIGTSSTRCMVFESSGQPVDRLISQVRYDLGTDHKGRAELDSDELVASIAECVDETFNKAGAQANRIAAAGICTFWHSVLGVDSNHNAITPVYTWADSRAAESAETLRKELDARRVHSRTGCAIHPSYLPAKLLWLRTSNFHLFNRVTRWLSPGEYLIQHLFGTTACSLSMASGTGFFDQNRCEWDSELLETAGITPDRLAPLTDIDSPSIGLRDEWQRRWPALAHIPWVPAIGDGAASNLGSGCADESRMAINLGTSGAIRVLWSADSVEIPPELWCYRLDRQRFVMGGAFSDGAVDYHWLRQTLQLADDRSIEAELSSRGPDSHSLTFLPFLAGERSTGWRPDARGTVHGLSLSTTSVDIAQAVMEGIALRFALVADVLGRRFPMANQVIASGGGVRESPVWARMIADALGRPVTMSLESEASCRGAALTALRAAGLIADEASLPAPLGLTVEPDAQRHAILQEALVRQQDLYARLM